MAMGQAFGLTVQSFATAIVCLVIALVRSWKLTLVIMTTMPIVVICSAIVEKLSMPLQQKDHDYTAAASGRVERAVGAITTVKAFNAEQLETTAFLSLAYRMRDNYNKLTMMWGFRLGVSQFFLMCNFVQGFWFGNYLVNKGEVTAGVVTSVFWATLIASAAFQSIIPYLNIIETGKISMASLQNLVRDQPLEPVATDSGSPPDSPNDAALPLKMPTGPITSPLSPTFPKTGFRAPKPGRVRNLRRLQPASFTGELALHNVTFHYPTRPHPAPPALKNIIMFLPAKETTFIVGQSGSGKSTVGSLLMGLYKPDSGVVEADEQGINWLDDQWLRGHIGMVSQGASVLFDGTVHDNVAIGAVAGIPDNVANRAQQLASVSRERVVEACRVALVHDFIRDLPDGYDTILSGEKGASLSGGQRQRLAIARAIIRQPTVLILG